MRKIGKFTKDSKKINFVVVGAFLFIGILIVGTSYALYQHEDEVNFISAKVRFPDASEVSYTNSNNSNVKTVEQALNDLYERVGK